MCVVSQILQVDVEVFCYDQLEVITESIVGHKVYNEDLNWQMNIADGSSEPVW